jgi:RNA polymerase sigma-70 factor (ECF subfamily)
MKSDAPSSPANDAVAAVPQLERYRQYLTILARAQVIHRGMRDRLDLSGVVQQTFLEAHTRLADFRGAAPASGSPEFAAWLRRILANNLADGMRGLGRAKRDAARERSLDQELDHSSLRLGAFLAAAQSSPSQHAKQEERAALLADAVAELPEAQRDVVLLRHCQGWGLSRIADHARPACLPPRDRRGAGDLA